MVNAYQAAYGSGGIWGNALTATGEAVDFTFEVPAGYGDVRLALTWPDPAGGTEVANDLDLYVYSNSACAGSPAAASTTTADTVECVSVAAGPPAGTWCAEVVGASLSSAQTLGLAVFANLTAPALSLAAMVDDLTPAPGQTIYLYTTITNSGSAAPGSYARLFVSAGFSLEGARAYTADGRSYYYAAAEIYSTGDGFWHVATGQIVAGRPRLVRWAIHVDDSTMPGAYPITSDLYCRCGQPQASGAAANSTYVFVGGHSVYVPMIVH